MRVVVVGAGPAGAALSFLLAERGVEVLLLERQSDFEREFRGEGLMPSGVDALEQMGLGRQLEALSQSRVERLVVYQGARRAFEIDTATPGFAPIFVSQPELLEMLVAEAGRFPSFRLERGVVVRDLVRENGRAVGVRGDAPEGPRRWDADFVIGADGRASALRKRSGLDAPGEAQRFDVVWCKVPLPDFLRAPSTGRAYLGHGHFCLLFPAADGRLQLGWIIRKHTFGELRARGVDAWVDELAAHVSPDLAAHLRATRADISLPFLLDVVCDRLERWTQPGLLLLGDACHPMSPVGAQGINIALRDALVACNHLAGPLAAGATPEAVDAAARAVQAEREPEVAAIQRLQQLPPNVLFQWTWWSRALVGAVLPLLVRTGTAARLFGLGLRTFANGTVPVRLDRA